MSTPIYAKVDRIFRREDARALDEANVAALVLSINESDLRQPMSPIIVRPMGERDFELIAGGHRLEAIKRLGIDEISAMEVYLDDDHAELAMIDENLCRRELSTAERSVEISKRKAVYERLHPETRNGTIGATVRHAPAKLADASFTASTAAATGRSERSIQRDSERGEKIILEVMDMIRGTPLDSGAFLDRIKNLPPNDQVHAVRREMATQKKRELADRLARDQAKFDAKSNGQPDTAPTSGLSKAEREAAKATAALRHLQKVCLELAKVDFQAIAIGHQPPQGSAIRRETRHFLPLFEMLDKATRLAGEDEEDEDNG